MGCAVIHVMNEDCQDAEILGGYCTYVYTGESYEESEGEPPWGCTLCWTAHPECDSTMCNEEPGAEGFVAEIDNEESDCP